MKKIAIATLAVGLSASAAKGQGLLSIGANKDYEEKIPFSVTLASSLGWDSNMNTSSYDEQESGYWQNGASLVYSTGDRRNHLNVGAHYSNIWYFDPAPNSEDMYHNARLSLDYVTNISPRLAISDSFYLAYETEPDYLIGASINRRTNQYLYGYNNLSVSYAWTRRFSTVSGYTVTGIWYEEDVDQNNDHFTHILSQQFRYSISPTTTATVDYRFAATDYDNNPAADYMAHYLLAGVDHSFSPLLTGSLRVGAELRDYDGDLGSETRPYLEGALNYRAGKNTILRWYHYLGGDDSDLAGFLAGYSYKTGLSVQHQLTERLTTNLALHYLYQTFEDSPYGLADEDDSTFAGSAGLDYRLWRNIGVNATYSYTNTDSDNFYREYERHRLSIGLTATF
jgi:opacity protein-like surface antigen